MNNFKILSEKSEHHWPFLNTKGSILLDLGCGRHDTPYLPDTTSVYLGQEAKKVISIDASQSEIDFFNTSGLDSNKFTFICKKIESKYDILSLINEYNPTVIKCDIEEYEMCFYDITKEEMSNVIEIAIEYHNLDIRLRIAEKINEWGFTIHSEGKFSFVHAPQMGVLFATKIKFN
jgi:hypothetical protein